MFIKIVFELVGLDPDTAAIWDSYCPSRSVPYLVDMESAALIWPTLNGGTFVRLSSTDVRSLPISFERTVDILTAHGRVATMDCLGRVKWDVGASGAR